MAVDLKAFTPARVGIGSSGHAVPTRELLRFQLDHARARDAVHDALDPHSLGLDVLILESRAPDRQTFLRRPDLGRQLSPSCRERIQPGDYDAALVIAGGLSARAVHRHAPPLLARLLPYLEDWKLAPLTAVAEGR